MTTYNVFCDSCAAEYSVTPLVGLDTPPTHCAYCGSEIAEETILEKNEEWSDEDFNMNAQMVNYLKQQYNQRTISGIQESNIYNKNKKMKNEQLKKLIKEEIKNLLELDATPSATPSAAPAEAISPSEFNIQLKAIYDQLKMSKAGITGQELELLLSIIKDIVGYTQQNTLSPTLSDRILKITN